MNKKNFEIKDNRFSVLDAFRFFFYLFVVITVFSFVFSVALIVISAVTGKTTEELNSSSIVDIISVMASPVIIIVFSIVYSKIRKVKLSSTFNDGQKISLLPISVSIVLAIIAIFLFTPFMELVEYGFMQFGYNPDSTIPLQDKMTTSPGFFFLGVFLYAVLPAVAEEIVFRGVIQTSLQSKFKGYVAILVTAVLFTLMHGSLQQTVYQMVMGIMLGYVACVGGSILYSIILHFLNNLFVLLFGCFDIVSYLSEDAIYYNIYSMIFPICLFLLGVVLVGILFWVLKYLRTKNFFRYEGNKRKRRPKSQEPENKIGLREMWKNLDNKERIFMLSGLVLVGVLWIIATIDGFVIK